MLLDEIKKKAQEFYNKNIAIKQKTKTTGETYLVKNNASEENIDTLNWKVLVLIISDTLLLLVKK